MRYLVTRDPLGFYFAMIKLDCALTASRGATSPTWIRRSAADVRLAGTCSHLSIVRGVPFLSTWFDRKDRFLKRVGASGLRVH